MTKSKAKRKIGSIAFWKGEEVIITGRDTGTGEYIIQTDYDRWRTVRAEELSDTP